MKEIKIFSKITSAAAAFKFAVRKHSPEILVTAGIAGIVTGTVMACRATLKVNDILAEKKQQLENIEACIGNKAYTKEYTEEDAQKDTAVVYIQTAAKMMSLYVLSALLIAVSAVSVCASNHILRKRCAAFAAAYSAMDMSFKNYRKRVAEKYGEDEEYRIRFGIKDICEEPDETGGSAPCENKIEAVTGNPYDCSPYARFFDETNPNWEKDSEYNSMFLNSQQKYANELLKKNGRLFLNEVYDMLGIPKTKAGQVVGWIYDKNNPVGDNYVDFGIYDTNRQASADFVNGWERSILLDFNVDGNIWEKMCDGLDGIGSGCFQRDMFDYPQKTGL